jgi:hypothetical protein
MKKRADAILTKLAMDSINNKSFTAPLLANNMTIVQIKLFKSLFNTGFFVDRNLADQKIVFEV